MARMYAGNRQGAHTQMGPEAIIPVILAGGQGRRLRPFVKPGRPKPLLRLLSGYSLLQETCMRAAGFAPPVVVCQEPIIDAVRSDLERLMVYGIAPRHYIAEPCLRSTAPAIAAACLSLPPYATIVVMPSDHVMPKARTFQACVLEAAAHVHGHGGSVSIGVRARCASRRFGYVHQGDVVSEGSAVRRADHFLEKPSAEHARICVRSGDFLWNTGVFVMRVNDYLQAFQTLQPQAFDAVRAAFEGAMLGGGLYLLDPEAYADLPSVSVDRGVLERYEARYSVAYDGVWDDVGTVPAFCRVWALRVLGIM